MKFLVVFASSTSDQPFRFIDGCDAFDAETEEEAAKALFEREMIAGDTGVFSVFRAEEAVVIELDYEPTPVFLRKNPKPVTVKPKTKPKTKPKF